MSHSATHFSRRALLGGASLIALLGAPPARAAGPFRSLTQALAVQGQNTAVGAAANGGGFKAARTAGLGAANLARAAQALTQFKSLAEALSAPANSAGVTDGVSANGLAPAAGYAGNPGLWVGASTGIASAPDAAAPGTVDVTVTQTKPVAKLTWQSFNVGAHTKLRFDQSGGGAQQSSWVVINTLADTSTSPSTILGEISAPGKVFIINRNGIAFGSGSQVNVGALVASTAVIAQSQFGTDALGNLTYNLYSSVSGTSYLPSFTGTSLTSAVTVAPGASIETAAPNGTSGGGYVMLLGERVSNAGVIGTPLGQTILAGGTDFSLRPGYSATGNTLSTTLGSEIAVSGGGTATNSGVIVADQGDITMVGHQVTQAGALLATTTVDQRGTVHLLTDNADKTAQITLAPGSLTEILPEDNGQTALDSQRASNLALSATYNAARGTPQGAQLNDYSALPDQVGESRIQISTGGSITMASGALAIAQGGQVAVAAAESVLLQSGAVVDVSGTDTAVLPASVNAIAVNIQPFQLRDSAGNRNGALKSTNVFVDARQLIEIASGAYSGNVYTPGGLLEVSGYLGLVPHRISEWTALGGQVVLQGQAPNTGGGTGKVGPSGSVVVEPGAEINLTGGLVTYQSGNVPQSYVVSSGGQVYNVNQAPGDLVYVGLYTGDAVAHPRWHVTDTYNNPLLTPATLGSPEYVVGRDAGTLTIDAATVVMQGDVAAGVSEGPFQTGARPANVGDPYLLAQSVVAEGGSLLVGNYLSGVLNDAGFPSAVTLGAVSAGGGGPIAPVTDAMLIDAASVNAADLATLTVATAGSLTVSAPLAVSDGGSVTLSAHVIDDAASITAHGGTIALTNLIPGGGSLPTSAAPGPGRITVESAVTLSARGVWTNVPLDPSSAGGEGHANGGSIAIRSTGGLTLAAGSTLDVRSGGAYLQGGKLLAASGGSIAVTADLEPVLTGLVPHFEPVSVQSQFLGYGYSGAGTLSLAAPEIRIGGSTGGGIADFVRLDPSFFSAGFASYALNGFLSASVAPGETVTVVEPVFAIGGGAPTLPSGGDPGSAYNVALLPTYYPNGGRDSFSQRRGASLSLTSEIQPTLYNGGGGSVTVGAGASLAVDPGQEILLAAYGQITVYGTLTAHSGTIALFNSRGEQTGIAQPTPSNYQSGLSIWLDGSSRLDVSGQAVRFTDPHGLSFGSAGNGGTIELGAGPAVDPATGLSTYAQIVQRPGAVFDLSGSAISVDVVSGAQSGAPGAPLVLPGNGGTLLARSYVGIALDGMVTAAGQGAGAAGGALSLQLDANPILAVLQGLPAGLLATDQVVVSQHAEPVVSASGLMPGMALPDMSIGVVHLSEDQIAAGGFDSVLLGSPFSLTFDGSVALAANRAIALQAPVIGDTNGDVTASVAVSAPYVSITGNAGPTTGVSVTGAISADKLAVSADLIDIIGNVDLGATRTISSAAGTSSAGQTFVASAYSFGNATFTSGGDLRLTSLANSANAPGALDSSGNLIFDAAQLYPTTGSNYRLIAGDQPNPSDNFPQLTGSITVLRNGAAPAVPYSVGGTLWLLAQSILQQGVIRAPEGQIAFGNGDLAPFGSVNVRATERVTLDAGSVTSISLDGTTVPYGGTADGVTYLTPGTSSGTNGIFSPMILLQAQNVDIRPGATVDLSGGGTLAGSGFIFGRGGSVDVNKSPLIETTRGSVTTVSQNSVYAIVPGYASGYAPVSPENASYAVPGTGEQITVGARLVPGLAAGTYTLLPAYYDQLPGAYRVELATGIVPPGFANAFGNFTTLASVQLGTANTAIQSPVPTQALFTSTAGVQLLAQYDTQTYSAFALARAATFDSPRPPLPEDAKTLAIGVDQIYGARDQLGVPQTASVNIAAGTIDQAPEGAGFGATVEITSLMPIEVVAQTGDAGVPVFGGSGQGALQPAPYVTLSAPQLDALNAPRLVLGGTLTSNTVQDISIVASAPEVLVLGGAVLKAGDVLLTTATNPSFPSGFIDVANSATISTIGEPATAASYANGFLFNSFQFGIYPVVDVSNTQDVFESNTGSIGNVGLIQVDAGATLLAGGSLDFVTGPGASVSIGEARLGARYVNLQVATINIGSAAALAADAALLPGGLSLTESALQSLLSGDAAAGVPAAAALILTATDNVNILGDGGTLALDTGSAALVLNTPAIYGYGSAGDAVSIKARSFTWSGLSNTQLISSQGKTLTVSALPGGQIAGSDTHTIGALDIAAQQIVLGYGPFSQAQDQVPLGHLLAGFGTVTLTGTQSITANNQGTLSVFATVPQAGQAGAGGALVLDTPLLTTQSGARLGVVAGGGIDLERGAFAASDRASVTTLGGEIDLSAPSVQLNSTVALPSGRLVVTATGTLGAPSAVGTATVTVSGSDTLTSTSAAQTITGASITVGPDGVLDLSGRSTPIFDQKVQTPGGTILFESASGTVISSTVTTTSLIGSATVTLGTRVGTATTVPSPAGAAMGNDIAVEAGSLLDVSAPGAAAGAISLSALGGSVDVLGRIEGSAPAGERGGSFSLLAGVFGNGTTFDGLNARLDAGGVTGARSFELATGDILVDQTVTANIVRITADSGSIEVAGTINASGSTPGSIALSAGGNLTVDGSARLDAHATGDARDSYGLNIDAENRAHVTLSATAVGPAGTPGGTLTIDPGAMIDLRYSTANPSLVTTDQGQLVLNAPRADGGNLGVQASVPGSITVLGAASIDLYAFRTYTPMDVNGTVAQGGSQTVANAVTLNQIQKDDLAFASGLGSLSAQLAGLTAFGASFNLAPGVLIEAGSASGGRLTISGDLDFSGLRISDPAGYGQQVGSTLGSGEAGSIQFRASSDLAINGSVTDGFLPPPDQTSRTVLSGDNLWTFSGHSDPLNADILLPATAYGVSNGTTYTQIELARNSAFSAARPISLDYAITINAATLLPNVTIPFAATVGPYSISAAPRIPPGGWIATAPVLRGGNVLFAKGALIPGNFVFQPGDILLPGTVLPVALPVATGTVVPAGTMLSIFSTATLTLAANTGILPVDALIPSGSTVTFAGVSNGSTATLSALQYRAPGSGGPGVQGYLYPLAQLMGPGSLSWSLDFGAGANLASADPHAVLPATIVNSDGLGAANTINQAPGSLLIDDQHYSSLATPILPAVAAFSVIRTGTGDLSFQAAGNIDQSSLFGIYTAGTQDPLPVTGSEDPNAAFNQPRQTLGPCTSSGCALLPGGKTSVALSALVAASYQAYYPNGGGDVSLLAQGNITSDQLGQNSNASGANGGFTSDLVGNWLWRQGTGSLNGGASQPAAWWINFGSYVAPLDYLGSNQAQTSGFSNQLVGFEGIGTLGGGNVTVSAGGNVGQIDYRDGSAFVQNSRGEGLDLAVGSTGRLVSGGTVPVITGGGTITLQVGGAVNPLLIGQFNIGYKTGFSAPNSEVGTNGDIIDLRGSASVTAGSIGQIDYVYQQKPANDPRPVNPFVPLDGLANSGIGLIPGDATIAVTTLRDLVVSGAADPGREPVQALTQTGTGTTALGVDPGFSLWTAQTGLTLLSVGGNATPTTVPEAAINAVSQSPVVLWNYIPTDYRILYPSTLNVTAASGSIYYGQPGQIAFTATANVQTDPTVYSLETAPSPKGQVAFLAGGSINANGYVIDLSGADPQQLSSPANPAVWLSSPSASGTLTNTRTGEGTYSSPLALFAFGPDTPTTNLHANDPQPARFYAATGDITNFQTGEILNFGSLDPISQWYIAAKPVWIIAGQDILASGVRPLISPAGSSEQNQAIDPAYTQATSSGDLFLNASGTQISLVSAGRDILSGYFYVGGPGLLEIDAGRNIYQASTTTGSLTTLQFGDIKSLGSLIQGAPVSLSEGAGIAVLAGIGAGPDYGAFASLYFDPANQANLSLPAGAAANQGKVQQTYADALAALLTADYGYAGDAAGALAFLQTLPAADQAVIVRSFFYDELLASGLQYNDPNSRFFHSYTRGRQAIDTLFPSKGPETTPGVPTGYNGTITMLSGVLPVSNSPSGTASFDAGVATLFGGSVQVLDPGGPVLLGAAATPAGGNSGIVTYGSGSIDIWSLGSVLLGQSRIFTTGGGDILIWSSEGDINAGIGAKTSITFNPPLTLYDDTGGITITPPASSSGAGIATLQSLANVPAGNVNLIAPLGVIDAGEAGIRSSGNINLAAQAILNAANLTAKGSVSGVATVPTVSLGAVQAAAGAAGAAANAAQSAVRNTDSNAGALPSVVDAEVVSIGGTYEDEAKKRRPGL